jgi:Domain of unknown function (DUF5122) beta-propeller
MSKFARSVLPGLLVFSLIVGVKSAWAAAGSLDLTFGQGGVTVTSFANLNYVIPYAVKLQNDGKILVLVVTGDSTAKVLRYTSTGTLDATFGGNRNRYAADGHQHVWLHGAPDERPNRGSGGGHGAE